MAWWSRTQGLSAEPKKSVPKGIWAKCERCAATLYDADLAANLKVCASCNHHFRMPTEARIEAMLDPGSWQEHDLQLESADPLGFRVDGKRYAGDPHDIELTDLEEIAVVIGTPPAEIPSTADFSQA